MPNGRGRGMGQGRGQGQGSGLFGSSRSGRWTIVGIIGAIAAEVIGNWIESKVEQRKEKKIEEKSKLKNESE